MAEEKKPGRTARLSRGRMPKITKEVVPTDKPFEIICSECYDDLTFVPRPGLKELYCAECDHGSDAPDEQWLARWTYYRGREAKFLFGAIFSSVALIVLGVVWLLVLLNAEPENWQWNTTHYIFLFLLIISFGLTCYFAYMYETNRYEAYF
ncbi:MAG: hypothetical protein N2234_01740 [Planctomycetota bacterium]|nr:hypothetical protein [Planctomycetota bacterium]